MGIGQVIKARWQDGPALASNPTKENNTGKSRPNMQIHITVAVFDMVSHNICSRNDWNAGKKLEQVKMDWTAASQQVIRGWCSIKRKALCKIFAISMTFNLD